MILTARAIIGEMLAIDNQAKDAEIFRLKVANAILQDELDALEARALEAEEAHANLTARVIAEVTG